VRRITAALLVLLFVLTACNDTKNSPGVDLMPKIKENTMNISSPAFEENTLMPRKYSCQGDDINPPLKIRDVPAGTKSLALIVDDPDAPMGVWDHWLLWNIPVISEIAENSVPKDAVQGVNGFGDIRYGGPCPPSGTHRYFFRLYALDTVLVIQEGATRYSLESAMQNHVLAKTQLIGLYRKS